jgi:hypothetical protein
MIHDLRTKLGHERLAKDEALETVRRLKNETRVAANAVEAAEAELTAERLIRRNAEDALAEVLEAGMEAERRPRDAKTVYEARLPAMAPAKQRAAVGPLGAASGDADATDSVVELHANDALASTRMAKSQSIVEDGASGTQARRRGRPTKAGNQDSVVVEWWKPSWQRKFR